MVDNSLLELGKLVDFFYHMDYIDDLGETHNQQEGGCVSLHQFHAHMFAYGDRYDIPALRHVAAQKYSTRCSMSWYPAECLGSIWEVY